MPDSLTALLDQNVPRAVAAWLRALRPSWTVYHAIDAGLSGSSDRQLFQWAQSHRAVIFTFDEDFADQRLFSVENHHGVVRLRV